MVEKIMDVMNVVKNVAIGIGLIDVIFLAWCFWTFNTEKQEKKDE